MKKLFVLLIIFTSGLFITSETTHSETIEYPFEQIRIVSATQFTVTLDNAPAQDSILNGNVAAGETFTVYIGELEFIYDGTTANSTSSIMILTDASDNDFLQWIVNSGTYDPGNYEEVYYASWILIDPEIGVIKDLEQVEQQVGYYKDLLNNETYDFIDNLDNTYLMDDGSLQELTDLDIVISAYVEEGTE